MNSLGVLSQCRLVIHLLDIDGLISQLIKCCSRLFYRH